MVLGPFGGDAFFEGLFESARGVLNPIGKDGLRLRVSGLGFTALLFVDKSLGFRVGNFTGRGFIGILRRCCKGPLSGCRTTWLNRWDSCFEMCRS